MASTPEVVSWDVDGTLYAMSRMRRAYGWLAIRGLFSPRVITNVRELRLLSRRRKHMDHIRRAGGVVTDALPEDQRQQLRAAEQRWYGRAIERAGVRVGVGEAIERFAEAGVRQVVVSDYEAGYKLLALGLAHAFERSYAGETLGFLKPSPQLFVHVAQDLGVSPDRILHIGDRADTDEQAARAAGCACAIIGRDIADLRALAAPETLGRLLSPGPGG